MNIIIPTFMKRNGRQISLIITYCTYTTTYFKVESLKTKKILKVTVLIYGSINHPPPWYPKINIQYNDKRISVQNSIV